MARCFLALGRAGCLGKSNRLTAPCGPALRPPSQPRKQYEELPSPLRDPPEDVQASLSPRLASLRLQGAGVAGAQGREFASQVPGGSLEPANAATLGPRFLSF